MHYNIPYTWKGSSDPDDRTGVATFRLAKKILTMRLESFSDGHAITELMSVAYEQGRLAALIEMQSKITEMRS
jgi:hypothetical protein